MLSMNSGLFPKAFSRTSTASFMYPMEQIAHLCSLRILQSVLQNSSPRVVPSTLSLTICLISEKKMYL